MNVKQIFALGVVAFLGIGVPAIITAAPIFWDPATGGNGHYYERILSSNLTWNQANATANGLIYSNLPGHLVAITSAGEQAFLQSNLTLSGNLRFWLGGYQDTAAPDYAEPAGGWRWVTGEAFSYANWNQSSNPSLNQPNNYNGNPENFLATFPTLWKWNDLIDYPLPVFGTGEQPIGFIVEYQAVPKPSLALLWLTPFSARLTWPTNAAGYVLESAPQLPAALWTPVTNQPLVFGDRFVLNLGTTNPSQFFRLREQ